MAEIEVFRARNTTGLAINGTRVTKTKPYGLIQTTQKFKADDEEITKALRIDVQPVKRGEWGKRAYDRLQCSYCGKCEDVATDFCPNCGADMRGR